MAPIPSKTHTAGEAFGRQMPPRGQRRCITRKARSLPVTNNLERLLCKLLERMCVCVYIYIYAEHLDWDCREDPPVLGVCLGMWNFLDILHARFMFIEPSKWPADQDAWLTGLPCNQRVVSYQKISKIIHLYPCQ